MINRTISFHSDEFPFIADDIEEIILFETEDKKYKKIKVTIGFYDEVKDEI